MSDINPNDLQTGIEIAKESGSMLHWVSQTTIWEWVSGVFMALISIIGTLVTSRFLRLEREVKVIKENYVKDSQYQKAMEKMESLNKKFDDKSEQIIDKFDARHDKMQKMFMELVTTGAIKSNKTDSLDKKD